MNQIFAIIWNILAIIGLISVAGTVFILFLCHEWTKVEEERAAEREEEAAERKESECTQY